MGPAVPFEPLELVAVAEPTRPVAARAAMRRQALAEGWDDVWEGDAGDFELPKVAAR